MLTEMDGLSREELANELGISLTAAKSRVHRARAKLRKTVEECCRLVTVLNRGPLAKSRSTSQPPGLNPDARPGSISQNRVAIRIADGDFLAI
jgi:Sigma-70, region 4